MCSCRRDVTWKPTQDCPLLNTALALQSGGYWIRLWPGSPLCWYSWIFLSLLLRSSQLKTSGRIFDENKYLFLLFGCMSVNVAVVTFVVSIKFGYFFSYGDF
jgi:hypothetical protein